jgi:hypothetical protein
MQTPDTTIWILSAAILILFAALLYVVIKYVRLRITTHQKEIKYRNTIRNLLRICGSCTRCKLVFSKYGKAKKKAVKQTHDTNRPESRMGTTGKIE